MKVDYKDDGVYGWNTAFEEISVVSVEGRHWDLFADEDNVKQLSEHLNRITLMFK